MKTILLICTTLFAIGIGAVLAQDIESWTIKIVEPLQITAMEEGKIPQLPPAKDYFDSISYYYDGLIPIDTLCLFHRCVSDTTMIGYVLVPIGSKKIKEPHNSFAQFKPRVTISDVQRAETTLAKLISNEEKHWLFKDVRKRFKDYGRQYLFFYNKDGDECVLINCSCEKYDWMFSRFYHRALDGGSCNWQIIINLNKDKVIEYNINGEA